MNEKLKISLLESGQYHEINKAHREWALNGNPDAFFECLDNYGFEVVKTARRMSISNYKREKRVTEKTKDIVLAGACVFLTLTFTDETLNKTTPETRRRYVSRFLKSQADTYVANIDFGGRNGREHYHALIYAPRINFAKWHKYGAIKGEKVRTKPEDLKRTSKYVVKLTRHALKKTGKGCRLIYSKNTAHLPPAFLFEE